MSELGDRIAVVSTHGSETLEFDSPDNSVWVVAVGWQGEVIILKAPSIDPVFFDSGKTAECLGLPFQKEDLAPGVYRWTCRYVVHRDWESGQVDDFSFEVIGEECLFSL